MSRNHDKGLDDDTTEIELKGPLAVEIDGHEIAQIISHACKGVEPSAAIKAANAIVDYLIAVHERARRPQ